MQNRNTNELGMSSSEFSTARSYLFSFLRYTGEKAWVSLSMMVLLGLSEGVGLIMMIPFLQLLGLDRSENDTIRSNLLWARRDATQRDLWTALELAAAAD